MKMLEGAGKTRDGTRARRDPPPPSDGTTCVGRGGEEREGLRSLFLFFIIIFRATPLSEGNSFHICHSLLSICLYLFLKLHADFDDELDAPFKHREI
jgi:hypothetical protein